MGANHGFSRVELVKNPVSLVCAIGLLGLMGDRAFGVDGRSFPFNCELYLMNFCRAGSPTIPNNYKQFQ
ncbi:hypothetical protein [Tychonema sp. LEGE 07203]|uniref:hypothetical protein n=1 Tax=Tychonema sp. LEGE 07203 TaxID=1828671 RepID=UPI001D140094|nr:hypothetical protein [Tychonema sp. LEGE 07203]